MLKATLIIIRQGFGQRPTKKAQVVLEFTLCFVVVVMFIMACFSALLWAGKIFVGRQQAYETTRNATVMDDAWAYNFYSPPSLNVTPIINRN